MNLEKKILLWYIGTFLLPPISWLLSAWYFNVWDSQEMLKVLLRPNIPVYVIIFASLIYYIVKLKLNKITKYLNNPKPELLLEAQKSAHFLPRFFIIILPIYTTLGDFPVLLPLDFIDTTEFVLGILLGVPIVFLFAIPFYITMNSYLEQYTLDIPFSKKYKALDISSKMIIVFLLSIIGITVFYISAVLGIIHNNKSVDLASVFIEKLSVTSLGIIALSFLNLQLFKKRILKPVHQLKENIENMARGEGGMTQRLEFSSRDEIGEISFWFNEFLDKINKLLGEIDNTIQQISNTGVQLNEVSKNLMQSTSEQASTTEEMATSMEEVLSQVKFNSEQARMNSEIMSKSANDLNKSQEVMLNTIEHVHQISQKINVITEIADKTDILSINAAIEASRSMGDTGFAVIAAEIRTLADKTKQASIEIEGISNKGKEISSISEKQLRKIIPEISKGTSLVNQIVEASSEQENGIVTINDSVIRLSNIAGMNSAVSEKMNDYAVSLLKYAKELNKLIAFFNLND